MFRDKTEEYKSPPLKIEWDDYPDIRDWVSTYIEKPYEGRPKSLIIFGATRLGKTAFCEESGDTCILPRLIHA